MKTSSGRLVCTTREDIAERLRAFTDGRQVHVNAEVDNHETPLLPLRVCLTGHHPALGYIRSESYFGPRNLQGTYERWAENGVRELTLEYSECEHARVFGLQICN